MPSGSKANILLVDDRPENLLALNAILEDLGHNLIEARSGREALARIAEQSFAVILLDVQMPIMDGFETAKLIRKSENAGHTPIVFLTAYESDEFPIDRAYSLGAVDYLVKPFVPVILRAKVQGFVQLYEQTEQIQRQAEHIRRLERQQFERTLAEKNAQLRESDALTAAIVATALDCIITMDHAGRVIEFNPAAEAVLGFKRADVLGKEVVELFIPESYRDSHRQGLAHCLLTGEGPVLNRRLELPALRADGSEILAELAVTKIPHREPPIFAAYLRDITERKRAERRRNARLAVTQALARADSLPEAAAEILQVIGEGVGWDVGLLWTFDADRQRLGCAAIWHKPTLAIEHFEAASRQLLMSVGVGLPGRVWNSGTPAWIPDVTCESNFPRAPFAERDGLRGAFGFPVLIGNEVLAVIEFFHREVREPDPDILEMAATLGNYIGEFVERRRAQDVLRASERRFALFMDQLPGLAWIKDADGKYVYANAAAEKAFGTSLSDLRGKTDDDLFPPETAIQFKTHDAQAMANDAGIQVIETLADETGELRHSLVCKFPIPSTEGEWRLVGGMAVDITDRLRAEEALREADRLKNQFLAMLAHELRNPLAPLATGLELLRLSSGNLDEERGTIDTMERQLSQMVRLIDDLLDVSRITQGKFGLRRGHCDLGAILGTAIASSRPLLAKAGVDFTAETPSAPIGLDADADRLAQVFSNLLNNSAKFTPRGGQVWLKVEQQGQELVVVVRDTGIGIPSDMLESVFGMFTQMDRSLERVHSGLGIGLSLVRAIVELHGGSVAAESGGLAQGSTFTVRLPVVAGDRPATIESTKTAAMQTDKKCRVLVIDDNLDAARMLALLLGMSGCEVRTANDGLEALEAASAFQPDLAFVDLGLPKLNGYEVARRIREMPGGAKITLVALTGWGQEEDRRRTQEAGFDHHLVKPADFAVVQQLVRSACDKHLL
jgi:PAS domain S-box-containing protein